MNSILTIDVGNTNVTCALFKGARISKKWRISTADCVSAAAIVKSLRAKAGKRAIDGVCIASVVPRLDRLFGRACKRAFGIAPLFATCNTIPMRIKNYDRAQLGADRLVAAYAAYQRYQKPVIVIDAGTAITIDLVNARGEFAGGAIVPGLATAAASLHATTAKLPLVKPHATMRTIGRNTREAINSGVVRGYAGLVDSLVRSIAKQSRGKPLVIATGGDAIILRRACRTIRCVDLDLIHNGLQLLWENLLLPSKGRDGDAR